MNRNWTALLLSVCLTSAAIVVWYVGWKHYRAIAINQKQLPYGWFRRGDNYAVGVDHDTQHRGNAAAYIRYVGGAMRPITNSLAGDDSEADFGLLLQRFKADDYRGKTIRMSAYVRTDQAGEACVWMRIDGFKPAIRFDNMEARPIRGTTDWQRYEITFDVPHESLMIFFGALMVGKGQMWVDNFEFEIVAGDPLGGASPSIGKDISMRPVDLDFEQ